MGRPGMIAGLSSRVPIAAIAGLSMLPTAEALGQEPPEAPPLPEGLGSECPPGALCEDVKVSPPEPAPEGGEAAPEPPRPIEIEPPPEPWEAPPPKTETADTVFGAGLGVFAVGYAPAFIVGLVALAITDDDDDLPPTASQQEAVEYVPMLLPVAGPPITGALVEANAAGWIAIGLSSSVQAVGIILMAVGGSMMEDDDLASLRPLVLGDGRRSVGFGLEGRF